MNKENEPHFKFQLKLKLKLQSKFNFSILRRIQSLFFNSSFYLSLSFLIFQLSTVILIVSCNNDTNKDNKNSANKILIKTGQIEKNDFDYQKTQKEKESSDLRTKTTANTDHFTNTDDTNTNPTDNAHTPIENKDRVQDNETSHPPFTKPLSRQSTESMQDILNHFSVLCLEKENCRGKGVLLSVFANGSIKHCNFHLSNQNYILTNAHCLPEEIRAKGRSCSDKVYFYFPDLEQPLPPLTGENEETPRSEIKKEKGGDNAVPSTKRMDCDIVSDVSILKDGEFRQDYAILKLKKAVESKEATTPARLTAPTEPTEIAALIPNQEGFKDQSFVRVVSGSLYKVKKEDNKTFSYFSEIETKKCRVSQNLFLLESFTNDHSSIISLTDCPMIPGNSGSTIINDKGETLGLIQSIYDTAEDANLETQLQKILSHKNIAYGTSLSCISSEELGLTSFDKKNCFPEANETKRKKDLQKLSLEAEDKLKKSNSDLWSWSLQLLENKNDKKIDLFSKAQAKGIYFQSPHCFLASNKNNSFLTTASKAMSTSESSVPNAKFNSKKIYEGQNATNLTKEHRTKGASFSTNLNYMSIYFGINSESLQYQAEMEGPFLSPADIVFDIDLLRDLIKSQSKDQGMDQKIYLEIQSFQLLANLKILNKDLLEGLQQKFSSTSSKSSPSPSLWESKKIEICH